MSLWSRVCALPPLTNKLNFPAQEEDLPKVMSASQTLVFEKPSSLRILPINCIMLKNNPITKDTAGHKNKSDFSKIEISLKLKKLYGGSVATGQKVYIC